MKQRIVSYAQNREDILLAGFFSDTEVGFYVDIGAHDPEIDSVTKYFYDRGWNGINVEPNLEKYEKLCLARTRDINVNLGISDKPGKLKLRIYDQGDGLSTFSKEMISSYNTKESYFTEKYHEQEAKIITMKSLFLENNVSKINFLKIDIEGYEYNALSGNDWEKYRPEVICIESNHIIKDWRKLLEKVSYKKVYFDGLNEYYVDNKPSLSRKFDYVESVIFKEPIINYMLLEDFEEKDKAIAWLETKVVSAEDKVNELQKELASITPLNKHIRKNLWVKLRHMDRIITDLLSRKSKHIPKELTFREDYIVPKIIQEYDEENYNRFHESLRKPMLLRFYLNCKKFLFGLLKRAHAIRVKKKSAI